MKRASPPAGLSALASEDEAILSFPLGDAGAALTLTESRVLREVLAGRSNAEIAKRHGRSVHTIANQVASILRKLNASSRVELAARMTVLRVDE